MMVEIQMQKLITIGTLVLLAEGCSSHASRISGAVSGAVTAGVTITLSGKNSATVSTDTSGRYTFTELADGTYTITPSLAGYTFGPASIVVAVNGADVSGRDFVATAVPDSHTPEPPEPPEPPQPTTHAIAGTVSRMRDGLPGVTMSLSGARSASVITGATGNYAFDGLSDGSYNVTPSLADYTFNPPNSAVTVNGADVAGVSFSALPVVHPTTHVISGRVSTPSGGLAMVAVRLTGAANATTFTTGAGVYIFSGLSDGTYTVTPELSRYRFNPSNLTVVLNGADVTDRDFMAIGSCPPPLGSLGCAATYPTGLRLVCEERPVGHFVPQPPFPGDCLGQRAVYRAGHFGYDSCCYNSNGMLIGEVFTTDLPGPCVITNYVITGQGCCMRSLGWGEMQCQGVDAGSRDAMPDTGPDTGPRRPDGGPTRPDLGPARD